MATERPGIKQGLLEDMFDQETVRLMADAQDAAAFPQVDEHLDTQYRCPGCGYEWSGNPKPSTSVQIEDDDGET